MRVLLVSNTFPPADISGVGTLVAELLRQLQAAGHDAVALVREAPAEAGAMSMPPAQAGAMRQPPAESGVVAVGGRKLLFPWRAARALRKVENGHPFDVIHVHESDGVLVVLRQRLARLFARPSGRARLVATLQVSYRRERLAVRPVTAGGRVVSRPVRSEQIFRWLRAPFHALLGRLTVRLADAVVAPSVATARELAEDYGAKNVAVIPNGIAPSSEPPRAAAGPQAAAHDPASETVLFVGRLRTRKAAAVLVEAFAAVVRERPRARLVLLGDGEQRTALAAQIARLGLSASVELAGAVPRAATAEWLRRADVFCLPSTYEGFPLAILEAMAEGLPVVATRVAGIPEAVEDGASGLLVPPEDDQALAAALLVLLSDPARRRAFGASGRALLAERFAIDSVCARHLELFGRLATEGR